MSSIRYFMDLMGPLGEDRSMAKTILEMPPLSTGPIDFQLQTPEINAAEVERLTFQPHRVIEHNGPFLLGQSVIAGVGEYFLINTVESKLIYYTEYHEEEIPGLGNTANECILWRLSGGGYPNITKKVFMGLMMDQYDAIISDRRHSPDGRRFWIDRMAEAIQNGWTVGLLEGGEFTVYDPAKTFEQWLGEVDGWGHHADYQDRQFMITKHAFEPE